MCLCVTTFVTETVVVMSLFFGRFSTDTCWVTHMAPKFVIQSISLWVSIIGILPLWLDLLFRIWPIYRLPFAHLLLIYL